MDICIGHLLSIGQQSNSITPTIHYGQHQAEGVLCLVRVGQIDHERRVDFLQYLLLD